MSSRIANVRGASDSLRICALAVARPTDAVGSTLCPIAVREGNGGDARLTHLPWRMTKLLSRRTGTMSVYSYDHQRVSPHAGR